MYRAARVEPGHGRSTPRALVLVLHWGVLYPLAVVAGAVALWFGMALLGSYEASASPVTPARSTAGVPSLQLSGGAPSKVADGGPPPARRGKKLAVTKRTSASAAKAGKAVGGVLGVALKAANKTKAKKVKKTKATKAKAAKTKKVKVRTRQPAKAQRARPRRSVMANPLNDRLTRNWQRAGQRAKTKAAARARQRSKLRKATRQRAPAGRPSIRVNGCMSMFGLFQRCSVTKIDRTGDRTTAGCVVKAGKRGCDVRAVAGGPKRGRVVGSCDTSGRCAAGERTKRGSSSVRFPSRGATGSSTLGVGSRCAGTGCAASTPTRRGRATVGCAKGSCAVTATGRVGPLRCVGRCSGETRARGRSNTTALARCIGRCAVRVTAAGASCSDRRTGTGCRAALIRSHRTLGLITGAGGAVCGRPGAAWCTARASLTGSTSCTSRGPQCRTTTFRTDRAGSSLISYARCAQHRAGRCSAISGQRDGYASACKGVGGHTFCRTGAVGPPGSGTAAARQTRGVTRATSDPHATSSCAGSGRMSTCESEVAAPLGTPTRAYCHGLGRSTCRTSSRVTAGSGCAVTGRIAGYCMASSPRGPDTATRCTRRGFGACQPPRTDPSTRTLVRSCAAAATGATPTARCATSSTGRSVAGPRPKPARPSQATGPMPDAVVHVLLPGYDPRTGKATDAQRDKAYLALLHVEASFQRSGHQLDRLEREGAAVRGLSRALRARGGVTKHEARAVRAATSFHRAGYTEQLDRMVSTGAVLDEVVRRSGVPAPRRPGLGGPLLPPRPVITGIAVGALGSSRRSVSTWGDAAERHRLKAGRLRTSNPVAAARQDRLAATYQDLSDRMRRFTEHTPPFRWSTRVQQLFAAAPADLLPKTNPTIRTVRRALTKVRWSSVVGAGVDLVNAVVKGKSVPHVLAKDGTTIAASSAAGGLTSAGVAALGGPPGWAVAGGIVVGTGVAWLVTETGAADWVADQITGVFG